jgi:hypothetical protein
MDVVFFFDILLNFNTGFYYKGVVVMKRHRIMLTYLRTWFLIDVLATFPYEYTFEFAMGSEENESVQQYSQAPQLLRMLKLIRFLRILRLLRVLKLKKFLYKLDEFIVTDVLNTVMDILKLLVLIFFISHLLACTFYYVGDYESTDNPENWIRVSGIDEIPKEERYMTSLYFSFSTMATVGYGDITPQTNLEKVYSILGMLIACGFTAYIIGSIGSIFNRSNIMANEIKLKSFHINQFLRNKEIPNDMRMRIMSYLEYLVENKK